MFQCGNSGEASSPNYPSKTAILNSPCFDLTSESSAMFSFDYHMYGATDMGTISLDVSNDNGTTWNTLWNESGNKGNSWLTANVDISSYTGNSVQLRFNRSVGDTWQADIAIDNINLITTSGLAKSENGKLLDVENKTNLNSFYIYPNPVKGRVLNIKLQKQTNIVSYKIINTLGQVVNKGNTTKEIPVGNLEAGTYFIEIKTENNTINAASAVAFNSSRGD